MDNDRIKGKATDIKGRVKRQVGEWTGDESLQAEGAAEQAGGKIENAWGKVKDGARELKDEVAGPDVSSNDSTSRSRKDRVA